MVKVRRAVVVFGLASLFTFPMTTSSGARNGCTIEGTSGLAFDGRDLANGGRGDDPCLNAHDGVGDDTIVGGFGQDTFYADGTDTVRSAEVEQQCGVE
jgi:hypothetical protein